MSSTALLYELQRLLAASPLQMVWVLSIQRQGWRVQSGVSKELGFLPSGLILPRSVQHQLLIMPCDNWQDTPSNLWYWCVRRRWPCQARIHLLELPQLFESYLLFFASSDQPWQGFLTPDMASRIADLLWQQKQGILPELPPLRQSIINPMDVAEQDQQGFPHHLMMQLQSERLWPQLLAQESCPWLIFDTDLHLLHANHAAKTILGKPPLGFALPRFGIAQPLWQACTAEGQALSEADLPMAEVLRTAKPVAAKEISIRNWQGKTQWLTLAALPVLNEGQIRWLVVHLQDISPWRLQLQHLQQQMSHVTQLFDQLPDLIFIINQSGQMLHFNQATLNALGLTRSEILYQPISSIVCQDLENLIAEHQTLRVTTYFDQRSYEMTVARIAADTELYWCRLFDLTDIESRQQQLLQAQRLAATGEMTSGLAHDLNNMLGVARGYAEMLSSVQSEEQQQARLAQRMLGAIDRATHLISNLLNFASNKPRARRSIHWPQFFANLEPMLQNLLGSGIELDISLAQDLPGLMLEEQELENALINLLLNSKHALAHCSAPRVEISLTRLSLLDDSLPIRERQPKDYLQILVQDNGHGMDEETQAKVFEPFYTTKGQLGSGLGLSQLYGFVRRHQGQVQLTSAPDQGACFRLLFPLQATRQSATRLQGVANNSVSRLLIVDDDQALLDMLAKQLPEDKVLMASSGQQAEQILAQQGIELVLLDINLGQENGLSLAKKWHKEYPGLQFAFMSALTDQCRVEQLGDLTPRTLLSKPILVEEIRAWLKLDL